MRSRRLILGLCGTALAASLLGSSSAAVRDTLVRIVDGPRGVEQDPATGTSYLVVGNSRIIAGPEPSRSIAIFVEPAFFTPERLRGVFIQLSKKFPAEGRLSIGAISNRDKADRWAPSSTGLPSDRCEKITFYCPMGNEKEIAEERKLTADYTRSYDTEEFVYYPAFGNAVREVLRHAHSKFAPTGDIGVDLVRAAQRGSADYVKKLVDEGADINRQNRFGDLALTAAVSSGAENVVRLLLDKGADINQTNSTGWSPLMCSLFYNSRCLDLLLARNPNLNIKSDDGRTALMLAIERGSLDIIEELIKRGADGSPEDSCGRTALQTARDRIRNQAEVLDLLKQAGATR